ncbi:MAG: response regulator [Candidatus Competibacteraceae bacterium]
MNVTKALVVDDSKVAHLTLRKLLMERNIEVDWVGSGEDAIAYMEHHHPHIIFMDVMMPGMDGFETTAAIITNKASDAPPIIMCSASATAEDRANARSSGAIEFLSKPYTPASIDKVLEFVRTLPEPVTAAAGTALPAAPGPAAEPAMVPALSQATLTASEVTQIAERAARAITEKVAAEIVGTKLEQLSRTLMEQNTPKLIQELTPKATQAAVQAAQEAVRSSVMKAMDAARDTLRLDIDEAAKAAAEQALHGFGEEMIKRQLSRGLMVIRDEMNKHLEQYLQTTAREMLTANLTVPEFKQQLGQLVKESALPLAKSFARQSANELTQEVVDIATDIGKQAKLALQLAVLALVLALGAAIVGFLY